MLTLTKMKATNYEFLRLTPSEDYLAELREMVELGSHEALSPESLLWDALEHNLANGWSRVLPEQIGALTDAPIISDEVEYDDHGDVVSVGKIYAYMAYQITSPLLKIVDNGYVDFICFAK